MALLANDRVKVISGMHIGRLGVVTQVGEETACIRFEHAGNTTWIALERLRLISSAEPEPDAADDIPVCAVCEQPEDDCECSICESCDRRHADANCSNCDRCENCCSCSTCSRCGERVEHTCSECDRCDDDCECHSCNNCGETSRHICNECDNCGNCCNCERGPRASQKSGFREAAKTQFKHSKLHRFAALELEVSKVSSDSSLRAWSRKTGAGLVADGSIPETGVEIVLRPANGDVLLDDCKSLGRALTESAVDIDDSCGLHVHVDARDYAQADLRRLILLYASVEQELFELVSRSRFDNTYCKPCGKDYVNWLSVHKYAMTGGKRWGKEWRRQLAISLYQSTKRDVASNKREKYHGSRYHAMNLHTFFYRKTIEFRMHEAHLSADVFANWTLLCAWLVERAYAMSEQEIRTLINGADSGMDVLKAILPEGLYMWVTDRLIARRAARIRANTFTAHQNNLITLASPAWIKECDVFQWTKFQTRIPLFDKVEVA